jgi:hypothetical protein
LAFALPHGPNGWTITVDIQRTLFE